MKRSGASTRPATIQTSTDVTGMTCASCERRIGKAVGRIPGVTSVAASSTLGRVDIEWSTTPDLLAVSQAVTQLGYTCGRPRWFTNTRRVWDTFFISLVVLAFGYWCATWLGITNISTGSGDLKTGGLFVVLLLGLAAGVSTCMALTGGLVLAVSAANVSRLAKLHPDATPSAMQRLRPVVVFNLGRIVGFGLLGAVLGLIGGSFTIPTPILAGLMITVALVMFILGIRLTELSPRMAGWSPTLPSGLSERLHLDQKATSGYSTTRTALLGTATFFLPCGFTQAAQLFALSTGSPVYAAAIMSTFALGTTPGIFVLGGLPELLPAKHRTTMLRALGVLVLGFALINGMAAFRLAGINPSQWFSNPATSTAALTANVETSASGLTLHTTQDANGYTPTSSVVYAGMPIHWDVNSVDQQSCAIELRAPGVGVSVHLNAGHNSIDLPAQQPGHINFSCSMGMYGGSITVVPKPAKVAPTSAPRS